MLKFYALVLVFGKIAGFTGPFEEEPVCNEQASAIHGQIISKAKAQNITSIKVEGKDAYEKDLSVVCKRFIRSPRIQINIVQ